MKAADVMLVRRAPRGEERGGCIGKVQALLQADPGLRTREITARVGEPRDRVSGALNKLKLEGRIEWRVDAAKICRWYPVSAPKEAERGTDIAAFKRHLEGLVYCPGGVDLVFGPLATDEERERPTCHSPFAGTGRAR